MLALREELPERVDTAAGLRPAVGCSRHGCRLVETRPRGVDGGEQRGNAEDERDRPPLGDQQENCGDEWAEADTEVPGDTVVGQPGSALFDAFADEREPAGW